MCKARPSVSHELQQWSSIFLALQTSWGGGRGEEMVLCEQQVHARTQAPFTWVVGTFTYSWSSICVNGGHTQMELHHTLTHRLHGPIPNGLWPSTGPRPGGWGPLNYSTPTFPIFWLTLLYRIGWELLKIESPPICKADILLILWYSKFGGFNEKMNIYRWIHKIISVPLELLYMKFRLIFPSTETCSLHSNKKIVPIEESQPTSSY